MLRNFLKITLRSLLKNKTYVLINIFGMGIALASCVVAYLNYEYASGFDSDQLNVENVYRVNFVRDFQGRVRKHGYTPLPMGPAIKQNVPELEEMVRFHPRGGNIKIGEDVFRSNLTYVDENFFNVFTIPLKLGNNKDISDRSKIYISEEYAIKYFGDEDPIGQQITHVLDSGTREYVVAGVMAKRQSNSSFDWVDAVLHFDNYFATYPDIDENNWGAWSTVYLKLPDNSRVNAITGQLQEYIEPQNKAREDYKITQYYLDPFIGMAVRTEKEDIGSFTRSGMPSAAATAPLIMAVMILLIACFNFTNTSIAISSRRLKEIALRKVMGGVRKQLVFQFLSENILLCLVALIVGLIMAEYLVPAYNQMWNFIDIELVYLDNIAFIAFLIVLIIFTGLIAGSYPAFYISKFEPANILKGTVKFGGAGFFPKLLLGSQYGISLLAIIMGIAFVQNAKYQEELDLGFDKEGVIYTRINDFSEFENYRNALAGNPEIEVIGGSEYQLYDFMRNDPIRYEDVEIETDILHVGDNYLEAMNIKVLEGRSFNLDSETDRNESILVSETFIKELGWADNPIGKRIVWADTVPLFVIGTIKDIYTNALWRPLDPMIIRYVPEEKYNFLTVKSSAINSLQVNKYMKEKWNEVFPNRLYTGRFIDENMREAALVNANIVKMFVFLGIVATILSATGLFTLVSLNIISRMKEIGIRKVLGASIANIAKNLNKQFFIILLVSAVIGAALGSWVGDELMGTIWAYHIGMNIPSVILSVILIFIISGFTVGFKVLAAARANPVDTLRTE